jgi:pilus assembly protein CpaE
MKPDEHKENMPTSLHISRRSDTAPRTETAVHSLDPPGLGPNLLNVVVIGPQPHGRKAIMSAIPAAQAATVREFSGYPGLDDLPRLLQAGYDVFIIELDSNPEHALDLIEDICASGSATVMVYSVHTDSELLVRCMRAGAREFLSQPVTVNTIAEAMIRASVRRPVQTVKKQTEGKLFVFLGAKGGSGVSTVAANFAVALAKESNRSTALLDLNFPMGSAAIELGLTAPLSAADALNNLDRLDSHFLSTVMVKHSSGLSVLAAPDYYAPFDANESAIAKLTRVVSDEFTYVVVDAGVGASLAGKALLDAATTIYLVLQVNLPELRNANRLINGFFSSDTSRLEIVLNRYNPRLVEIDEENIRKALTTSSKWKIPSDYASVRRAQNSASPIAFENSSIATVIRQMVRCASGAVQDAEKKKKFGIFRQSVSS